MTPQEDELVKNWIRPGAIVPVTPESVRILVNALRAALAQPEQEPIWGDSQVTKPEVVAEQKAMNEGLRKMVEQEPVAWIYSHKGQKSVSMNYVAGVRAGPLYLSPLQAWGTVSDSQLIDEVRRRGFVIRDAKIGGEWHGLTEKEHEQIAIDCGCASADWVFYGAAVERKLREKNT